MVHDSNSEVDAARCNGSKPAVLPTPTAKNAKLYSMNGAKRGKVLIFNQENFDDESYPARTGTDKDVERLNHALPRLGFQKEDIEVHKNMMDSEINGIAVNLENNADLKTSDCLVVVILTHGEENDMLMAKDKAYNLYEFIEKFTPTTLKSMAGKPKLFIIQACRGVPMGYSGRDQVDSKVEIFTYPEFADLVVVRSSQHSNYGFLDEQRGSWLIQDLCHVIESCELEKDTIYDILTVTQSAVSERCNAENIGFHNTQQIPSIYSTLTKKLYFRPST
ncbi:caspase-1-like [Ochlerotatus camptorhynchus]|uniref:caspase-1-like n=1 Tax=Ochlerotatus camptorhynchus TaxID=644619 RepID=UPI0031CFCCF5